MRLKDMVDPSDINLDPNWEFVPDAVMGGISDGSMTRETYQGREATVLRGDVSLDNNGGFIQIAFNLRSDGAGVDASAWTGWSWTFAATVRSTISACAPIS